MNVSVRRISSAIRTLFAKNAQALNVNARHHTNSLVEIVYWLDVKMAANAQQELNVSQLPGALAIARVQRVIEHNRMVVALTSMNVLRINISAALALSASIDQAPMNVCARQAMMEILIMANAQHRRDDAHQTENVVQTKNAFNPANAFARRHSFWTQAMETSVKTHANVMRAVSMQNAHQPIHHSVCAKLDSKGIHCKDASMKMNARHTVIHAHMEHSASIKKEVINAFARQVKMETHTKEDAHWPIQHPDKTNAVATVIVLILWLVYKALALAHARAYCVVKMHIANRKIMQLGVDAASVLRKMKAANVFHVSIIACFH